MFTQQGSGIVSALAVIVVAAVVLAASAAEGAALKVFSVDAFGAKPNQRVDSAPAARAS